MALTLQACCGQKKFCARWRIFLKISKINFVMNSYFLLAPMATLSHEAFRRTVASFGFCDEYFNEMINAGSLIHQGPFEKYYLMNETAKEKLVWQITGSRKDYMVNAASVLCGLEGRGIDINMGCCAPQIACTGAGISWMTKPVTETMDMVRSVKSQIENSAKDGKTPLRLSVKLRLGDEDFTEEKFFSFVQNLIDEGVQMITLHPRTRKEKLSRPCRWEFVQKTAEKFPHIPVVLNGAVKDMESFVAAKKAAPASSGIMIARSIAQKPWLFAELSGKSLEIDCEELALNFIDNLEQCQPEEFWPTRIKRFFTFFCLNFSFGHYFQTKMLNVKDNMEARKTVEQYFKECPGDRIIHVNKK